MDSTLFAVLRHEMICGKWMSLSALKLRIIIQYFIFFVGGKIWFIYYGLLKPWIKCWKWDCIIICHLAEGTRRGKWYQLLSVLDEVIIIDYKCVRTDEEYTIHIQVNQSLAENFIEKKTAQKAKWFKPKKVVVYSMGIRFDFFFGKKYEITSTLVCFFSVSHKICAVAINMSEAA